MPRPPIESGEVYHIYNRGVDKRDIFMDDGDRIRFIHHLYHFNTTNSPPNLTAFFKVNKPTNKVVGLPKYRSLNKRDPIVDIIAFVLMPNHYHLMIKQRENGGISKFMHRLGTGYTQFFNEKYDRTGALFQGKYKYKPLETDAHFLYLPHYIHLNPLALLDLGGPTTLIDLLNYKWSSLPDFVGKQGFPSVINPRDILDVYKGRNGYLKDIELFVSETKKLSLSEIRDIVIDFEK